MLISLRSFALLLALAEVIACARLTDRQRAALEADAESFEAIVRSQVTDSATSSLGFLRVDARPAGDDAVLAGAVQTSRPVDLSPTPDSMSRLTQKMEDQRRSILRAVKVDEGGPFDYPYCGGARRGAAPPAGETVPE